MQIWPGCGGGGGRTILIMGLVTFTANNKCGYAIGGKPWIQNTSFVVQFCIYTDEDLL